MQWFRGGLVIKARRLLYHSTLGVRIIKEKKDPKQNNRCARPPAGENSADIVIIIKNELINLYKNKCIDNN